MKKYFLLPLVTASFIAAGCAAPPTTLPPSPPPPATQPAPSPSVPAPVTSASTSTPAPPSTPPSVTSSSQADLSAVDSTWKTYTNGALKFSFQWPTRGRYAPTWGVTFVKDDAPKAAGCTSTLTVSGLSFCHVSSEDAATGSRYFMDMYDTTIDKTYVRITFKKHATIAAMTDLPKCPKEGLLISSTACVPFDPTAYHAHLDQIVSTFRKGL
ncbi:MAG: hypothetical protein AAB879_03565 [Patescibacteria group bacterium]